jgi:hypothetical protein
VVQTDNIEKNFVVVEQIIEKDFVVVEQISPTHPVPGRAQQ